MPDGSLLMLLSQLSEHTRHLVADPRCSVMVGGVAVSANPQTTPRVTVTGVAEVVADAGLLVGGFARAVRLKGADLVPSADAVAGILAAEAGILAHCNRDHADALAVIAGSAGDWRMVAVDVDGFDLALGEVVVRVAWSAPVRDAGEVRRELVRMVTEGRGGG